MTKGPGDEVDILFHDDHVQIYFKICLTEISYSAVKL